MRVIALVGSSGTGKSHRALYLAHEKDIEYIVDDGLLIKGNRVIAGKSAKREHTKISAVKRALFFEQDHREKVIEAIKVQNPESILVIGTSERMVNIIAENLCIAPINEIVYIEDIATLDEINAALNERKTQGKHVIPVPTFEIKKDFSGYFLDPLKIFKRKKDSTVHIAEKSVVRPTFSYMGKYIISDRAISQIIKYVGKGIKGLYKISRIGIVNYPHGIVINVDVVLEYGQMIKKVVKLFQTEIKNEVERMTSVNILSINISVKSLKVNNSKLFTR